MSKTRVVNGNTYHIHTNRHVRELVSWHEMPLDGACDQFDYVYHSEDSDEIYTPRFFKYRGEWYDSYEFERASHDVKAMGFDAMQVDSFFSATVIGYFDSEGYDLYGAITVGFIHW